VKGSILKVDPAKCPGIDCDRICESMFPDFLLKVPIQINEWSMNKHGQNYSKIMNLIKYCPCKAVYLDAAEIR